MKNLSTPVADKKCPILEANETIYNRNEGITFKNNPAGSDSPFFVNISPINMSCNMNKTREVMSNHENNGSGAILHNDPLEDDLSSLECKTSTNPEVIGMLSQNLLFLSCLVIKFL